MNKYLMRKYYENDVNGFYYRKMNLSCPEQMVYQTLRDYNIDFDLFFCDDINIKIQKPNHERVFKVKPNSFQYYTSYYKEIVVTENYENACESIDYLLGQDKIVIYQAPCDLLKTYCWYNGGKTANIIHHNAILVGQDNDYYFYLDSPPTRSKKNYIPHPMNSAIGKILKQELLEAFKIKCKISFIDIINEQFIGTVNPVDTILKDIVNNYNNENEREDVIVGRQALTELKNIFEEEEESNLSDPFIANLICSRHKKLLFCGLRDQIFDLNDRTTKFLQAAIAQWELMEALIIKRNINDNKKVKTSILDLIERYEETIACFIDAL